jgi:hemolysin III
VAVAVVAGGLLVAFAPEARARLAALVYTVCVAAMFATSAVYHRRWWTTERARMIMRRLDHSTIALMIAGTYTPFSLLVLEGWLATAVLAAVWGGAVAGVVLNVMWPSAPRWVAAAVYLALGWVGVISMPQLFSRAGVLVVVLLMIGGVAYSLGAIVYARKRPDPWPRVFGYHELFHALVAVAAVAQFVAVAHVVL